MKSKYLLESEKTIDRPVKLSDGTVIEPAKKGGSKTGYQGSTYDTAGGKFRSWISRDEANKIDPRLLELQPDNYVFTLGGFDDAREAAYASSYFKSHPEEFVDRYLSLVQRNGAKAARRALFTAFRTKFPKDLYDLPIPEIGDSEESGDIKYSAADNLMHIAKVSAVRNAEDTFMDYLQNNPAIRKAWMDTGEEKADAKQDAIDKIKGGYKEKDVLSYLTGYLSESKQQKTLSESKQILNRLQVLSGLKK